jgi:hypothetical protein
LELVWGSPRWGGSRVGRTLGDGAWDRRAPGAGARLGPTLGDGAWDRRALGGGDRLGSTLGDGAWGRRILGAGDRLGSTLGYWAGRGQTVGEQTGCLRGVACGGIVARGSGGVLGAHAGVGCDDDPDGAEGGLVLVDDAIRTDPPVADGGMVALKIVASCCKASNCDPPMMLNVAAGDGCIMACVSSWDAMVTMSLDDVRGIVTFAGKKYNVSTILSALVLLIWTL